MIDTNKLRGVIAERGMTQQKVAEKLGVSRRTFYLKMKKGEFSSSEMSALITILGIKEPMPIFFAEFVS